MSTSNTKDQRSDQVKHGENEEHKAQWYSSARHGDGDDNTGDKKRRRCRESQGEEQAR